MYGQKMTYLDDLWTHADDKMTYMTVLFARFLSSVLYGSSIRVNCNRTLVTRMIDRLHHFEGLDSGTKGI